MVLVDILKKELIVRFETKVTHLKLSFFFSRSANISETNVDHPSINVSSSSHLPDLTQPSTRVLPDLTSPNCEPDPNRHSPQDRANRETRNEPSQGPSNSGSCGDGIKNVLHKSSSRNSNTSGLSCVRVEAICGKLEPRSLPSLKNVAQEPQISVSAQNVSQGNGSKLSSRDTKGLKEIESKGSCSVEPKSSAKECSSSLKESSSSRNRKLTATGRQQSMSDPSNINVNYKNNLDVRIHSDSFVNNNT